MIFIHLSIYAQIVDIFTQEWLGIIIITVDMINLNKTFWFHIRIRFLVHVLQVFIVLLL